MTTPTRPLVVITGGRLLRSRRHMTAAQRAMATAFIYPESDGVGGRGKKGKVSETDGFSKTRLKIARAVLALSADRIGRARWQQITR